MGFIYKLTAPTGEIYIGQTINSVKNRWAHHCYNASGGAMRLIAQKIREYGPSTFMVEPVKEVDDEDLDYFEQKYISQFNCIYPNGLNMCKGGGGFNISSRQKLSESLRKHILEDYDLPMHVRIVITDNSEEILGFRVDIPGKKAYSFRDSSKTLQENYDCAIKKYNEVLNGQDDPTENRKKKIEGNNLPQYVYWTEGTEKKSQHARVIIPGHRQKKFSSTKKTKEQLIADAIKFRNDLFNGVVEDKPLPPPKTLPKYIFWRDDQQKATFREPKTNKSYNFQGKGRSKDELIALAIAEKEKVLNSNN